MGCTADARTNWAHLPPKDPSKYLPRLLCANCPPTEEFELPTNDEMNFEPHCSQIGLFHSSPVGPQASDTDVCCHLGSGSRKAEYLGRPWFLKLSLKPGRDAAKMTISSYSCDIADSRRQDCKIRDTDHVVSCYYRLTSGADCYSALVWP